MKLNIIKLYELKNAEYNIKIDLNLFYNSYYLENINLYKELIINNNYFKYFKYQYLDNELNKKQIRRNIYKQRLTSLTLNSINSMVLNNYINDMEIKNNIKIEKEKIYNFDIISFKKQDNKILYNNIFVDIRNYDIIKNLLLKYGGIIIKIFTHTPHHTLYVLPYKHNYNLIDFKNKIATINLKDEIINFDNLLTNYIKHKLAEIQKNIIYMLKRYSSLSKYHMQNKDFYEIIEHLIFNSSFDYLKQNGLKKYINKNYMNQFNEKKEILFTNNKYIQLYYPAINDKISNKLQMTNVGLYSISKPDATLEIINLIKKKIAFKNLNTKDLIITDGTAGLGGDTIAFAKEFKVVNSVEIQKIHHNAIKHNAQLFNLDNINHINDDYTKVYDKLVNNVIFLDSPWGGTSYLSDKKTELLMFGTSLKFNDFIKNCLKINKDIMIFIKCPINYSVEQLDNDLYNQSSDIKLNNFEVNGVANFLLVSIY